MEYLAQCKEIPWIFFFCNVVQSSEFYEKFRAINNKYLYFLINIKLAFIIVKKKTIRHCWDRRKRIFKLDFSTSIVISNCEVNCLVCAPANSIQKMLFRFTLGVFALSLLGQIHAKSFLDEKEHPSSSIVDPKVRKLVFDIVEAILCEWAKEIDEEITTNVNCLVSIEPYDVIVKNRNSNSEIEVPFADLFNSLWNTPGLLKAPLLPYKSIPFPSSGHIFDSDAENGVVDTDVLPPDGHLENHSDSIPSKLCYPKNARINKCKNDDEISEDDEDSEEEYCDCQVRA